ncbi:MAG: beta-CASP ribonuclease aCPSF1, partial [Thermoplasmata archaeon]|nr:beta-CASP ribonuclease aCPSF1 [Candidatus Sysuiplasma acidicola]
MSLEKVLDDVKETVRKIIPSEVEVTNIDFEASVVVIYIKNFEAYSQNSDIVRQLAQALKRRVDIRPDPSLLANKDDAEKKIREIIPDEAQVTDIFFDDETGEVIIEAISPGVVIGKQGAVLNEIKREIGWATKVVRAPPIPSKTIGDIRTYMRSIANDRKDFLRKVGKRLYRTRMDGDTWIRITSLGGFREVGRSSTLLSTRESKVLIDCGLGTSDQDSGGPNVPAPYLNAPELQPIESIDAVVITHAHLDHTGLLPALFKYGYDGPVYCTPPTRDMMSMLQLDMIKVAFGEGKKPPYESSHIRKEVANCITLKYGETTDIAPDIRLTFQNAGHILGSAVSHFHIGDGLYNIAFSGDIKFEKTWLFNPANNKFPRLEALVMESTYGGYRDIQASRQEASVGLKNIIERVLARNGKVIIPVFAVGRSQEIMLVLEELMRTGQVPTIPVWLDGMIWEATAIHTAYPEYLNSQLRTQIFQNGENPFLSPIFRRVDSSETRARIISDPEPCIVLATSGMMNGGPVLEYMKHWADDQNNTLIFVGYQAEGTLGRKIQRGIKELQMSERGQQIMVPVTLNTETVDGFSGHSDRRQLLNFVAGMEPKPSRIFLGHGEEYKCLELASTIHKKFGIDTKAPMNLETV